ncbi:uncharacterized protein LOC133819012 isoform X2 [Humulus lupulus]|uniref:uncharacterized protein LOC133819012 isoform X2 n=1 Tax=Humulus lupulus TaxID=3486 RepID=UPI002B40788F|nr:uncharacterized protein LOC133819012 isoform X2 [Humulus lupulus]
MRGRDLDSAVESGINKGNVENLITQDVHNNVDDEELKIYGVNGGVVLMVFAQGNSHCFAYFKLAYRSLLVNGVDYSTISLEVREKGSWTSHELESFGGDVYICDCSTTTSGVFHRN